MKYIKKFNGSAYAITPTIIRKEAKDHLAYLLDDKDWQVLVTNSTKDGKNNIRVNINYEATDSDDFYIYISWSDVKDDILQYLELASKKYKILGKFTLTNDFDTSYTLQELEDVSLDVSNITFTIEV
jgi:predicted transcriptional regulator YdeE